jgi:HEAT repeat protein
MSRRSGRRWLCLLGVSAVVLVSGLACFLASRGSRQPVYEGKTLALWLRTYSPSSQSQRNSPEWKKADDAVRQLGTNCIPVLLRMLRARDSQLKRRLISLVREQRLIKIDFVAAEEVNVEASRAFIVLANTAKDAVPALMKMYNENISTESRRAVADAIAWIGPPARPAIPMLLGAATNSDWRVRANALWALGEIHAEPQLCVPKMIFGLHDSNSWVRTSAAHALGMFGADAEAALAPLSTLTNSNFKAGTFGTDIQVSIEAQNALRKIRPQVESFPGIEVPTAEFRFIEP